jgi:hypothetical protein
MEGCPTATDTRTVRVSVGKRQTISLAPRACGTLSFDATPPGARFTLASLPLTDSSYEDKGELPANGRMLPAGRYSRTIYGLPKCSPFGDTVTVEPNQPKRLTRTPLFCR